MNPQLNYLLAQQRIADLRRRDSHYSNPIVCALPMPTAHPSPEAWPAASLPAGMSPTPARPRARPPLAAPVPNTSSRRQPA
jgi:hypothetical protein